MTKVAINGFGRIGRLVARAILERPDCGLELVSVNDLADAKANAWLFKHDSVHGKFPGEVKAEGNDIVVDGKRIQVTAEKDPAKLPHKAQGRRDRARMHRLLHRPRERAETYRRRREAGPDFGAGQGRRPDRRLRRQRRQADGRYDNRLERVVHDQLPGAGRQGAERCAGHRARADDHHPRLHQRPEDPRPDPPRPAPRPGRGDVDDPDHHRRRARGRRSAARTEGQARRLRDPRAGARRQPGRPDLHARPRHHTATRSTRSSRPRRRRRASRASSIIPTSRWFRSTSCTPARARPSTASRPR